MHSPRTTARGALFQTSRVAAILAACVIMAAGKANARESATSPAAAATGAGVHAPNIIAALHDLGVPFEVQTDPDGDPMFRLQLGQTIASLAMYRDEDRPEYTSLRLRASFELPAGGSLDVINQWNMAHRFSTAYLSGPHAAVIKAYLDTGTGVTHEHIQLFLTTFAASVDAFRREIGFQ